MLLIDSVLKTVPIPDKHPELKNLLFTGYGAIHIFTGDKPDMNYKETSNIIVSTGQSVIVPKRIFFNKTIHLYATGATNYIMAVEVQ